MAVTDFADKAHYSAPTEYQLLPFRFDRRENGDVFLSNEVGEFLILPHDTFRAFISHKLTSADVNYLDLKAKHFLVDGLSSSHMEVLAAKYRTKKSFLDGFTKLHIFVTTLRCDQSCPYCQVSRQGQDASTGKYDMSPEVLEKSVRLMLASPAPHVTMEFQGGEPLVNFDLIKDAVRITKELNKNVGKTIDYVLCTNLTLLSDEHLEFLQRERSSNIDLSGWSRFST